MRAYHDSFDRNARLNEAERTQARRDMLKVFERAIHITATDVGETYVIRNLADYFDFGATSCPKTDSRRCRWREVAMMRFLLARGSATRQAQPARRTSQLEPYCQRAARGAAQTQVPA